MISLYCQCLLEKNGDLLTTWIPKKFAVVDKILKIKNDDGWDNGWKVIKVGELLLNEESVASNSLDYRRTREASDI